MRKLIRFELPPSEWRDYETRRVAMSPLFVEEPPSLSSFESFYREAQSRDGAMVKKVLKADGPGKKADPLVLLVAGGFHSPGLTRLLNHAGWTVLSFTPRVDKIETDEGSAYLSVFTREKTPLEKLFEGEKLFLAQAPMSQSSAANLVKLAIAGVESDNPRVDLSREEESFIAHEAGWPEGIEILAKDDGPGKVLVEVISPDKGSERTHVVFDQKKDILSANSSGTAHPANKMFWGPASEVLLGIGLAALDRKSVV